MVGKKGSLKSLRALLRKREVSCKGPSPADCGSASVIDPVHTYRGFVILGDVS